MKNQFIELIKYREMLWNLVVKELGARYKRSVIGFFWSFLNPLLMMGVYSVVFSTVMRVNIDHYEVFLLTNLLPWTYFQSALLACLSSIVNNANLVKKVAFPHEVLPFSVTISSLINFLLSFLVLVVAFLVFGKPLHVTIFYTPLIMFVETLLALGVGLLLAALNTFYRDVEHIVNVLVFAWFYVTPVLYPLKMVPTQYKAWFQFNPMSPIIDAYSKVIYQGVQPDFQSFEIISLISMFVFLIGMVVFNRVKRSFAEGI